MPIFRRVRDENRRAHPRVHRGRTGTLATSGPDCNRLPDDPLNRRLQFGNQRIVKGIAHLGTVQGNRHHTIRRGIR